MEGEQEKEFVDNGFEALRGNVENTLSSEEHDSAAVNEFLSNVHQEELRPDSGEARKDETRNAGDPQRSPTRQEPIANQQSNEESRNRTMDSSAAEMPMTEKPIGVLMVIRVTQAQSAAAIQTHHQGIGPDMTWK